MLGTFAGKYAFRSTNTKGPVCYLTSYLGESHVYPSVSVPAQTDPVSAPALTDSEKVILYAQDGGYVVVLVVPAPLTGEISLAYLKGQPDLGFVTTDPLPASAQELRISSLSDQPGTWSIYDTSKGAWTTLGYIPEVDKMAVLFYSFTATRRCNQRR